MQYRMTERRRAYIDYTRTPEARAAVSAHTLHDALTPRKDERDIELIRRYEAGEPIASIARSFGVCRTRVQKLLERLRKEGRVNGKRPPWS